MSKKLALNDFEILCPISSGTYGEVKLCYYHPAKMFCCCKILKKQDVYRRKSIDLVMEEKNIMKILNHKNIVKLFETFNDEENLYFFMEFVPGGELFTYIEKYGMFNEDVVKFYAAEMVLALEYLHQMNVVYGDLKPENILLDRNGHIKLVDFGFSKQLGKKDKIFSMCGTPGFIAPEIINGNGFNHAVDWWSLGVTIYELLTGGLPYSGSTFEILDKIQRQEEVVYPKFLTVEAVDLLKNLLEFNPENRYTSVNIKSHPWFKGLDWNAIDMGFIRPPIIPFIASNGDTRHYPQRNNNNNHQNHLQISLTIPNEVKVFLDRF